MKLNIPEFQVGKDKAEKYILNLCKDLGCSISDRKDLTKIKEIDFGGRHYKINLPKEVDIVRKSGKADVLQRLFDSKDPFLNMFPGMSVATTAPGLKINITSSYGSHSVSVNAPGFIEAPEISFSDDISFYRKEAVVMFNQDDIPGFARAYRAYLLSCISLLDCVIHRYAFHIKALIPSTHDYANTKVLDSICSFDEKLEAWMTTFAAHKIDEYKKSKYWSKFIELKTKRNEIVHSVNPHIGYDIKDSVKYLNYVQDGVGGFLAELRKYAGQSENIGFIRQVKTQAEITIITNPRTSV
ncbi:hypothetical protein [Methylomonas sp. ZR1]|uniref:hypothetical protein n=1 Tax=Methylomonas sp. ZR1 TaxID=1797072 RepID=UPI00149229B1|nr:hypothetical protein [Methylomonas sp. ZR1]NOV28493.1 hypothetical protein [Methylomonas sp. ZR1]